MSRRHTISKESITAELARHGTKRPDGKEKETNTPSMRDCQKKLPSFLFTTNIIPPDRVQIFDTFLFSGGAFRSSAGCLHPHVFSSFSSFLPFIPSFKYYDDSGSWAGRCPIFSWSSQHVLCTKLKSADARVVSKRYSDALKQGKERAPKLGARHSCSGNSIARGGGESRAS